MSAWTNTHVQVTGLFPQARWLRPGLCSSSKRPVTMQLTHATCCASRGGRPLKTTLRAARLTADLPSRPSVLEPGGVTCEAAAACNARVSQGGAGPVPAAPLLLPLPATVPQKADDGRPQPQPPWQAGEWAVQENPQSLPAVSLAALVDDSVTLGTPVPRAPRTRGSILKPRDRPAEDSQKHKRSFRAGIPNFPGGSCAQQCRPARPEVHPKPAGSQTHTLPLSNATSRL